MIDLSFLPHVNAGLNATATVLLLVGLFHIKRKNIESHKRCMITAFAVSTAFFVLYITHNLWKGSHTPFNREGYQKLLYLIILFSHLTLAMLVPVFAVVLVFLGLKRRDRTHRRIAIFGFPIWLYVSVTGVVIYVMLYHLNT